MAKQRSVKFWRNVLTVILVRETYPLELCKHELPDLNLEKVQSLLTSAKENDSLKKGELYCLKSFKFNNKFNNFSFDASL